MSRGDTAGAASSLGRDRAREGHRDDFAKNRHRRARDAGQVYLKKGALVPMHSHESEQMTYVLQGALKFLINGEEITVREGEVLHIPSWVEHQAEALDDTFELDLFSPIRQDWLDHTDTYFQSTEFVIDPRGCGPSGLPNTLPPPREVLRRTSPEPWLEPDSALKTRACQANSAQLATARITVESIIVKLRGGSGSPRPNPKNRYRFSAKTALTTSSTGRSRGRAPAARASSGTARYR